MRFGSALLQSGKQFLRNKSHALTIMFGIIISITLISGILYATNNLTNYDVQTNLQTVPFDISVNSATLPATVESGWSNFRIKSRF